MPKQDSRSTLSRQWELLKKLPHKHPGITTGDLHNALKDKFDVSRRTIERDLQSLSCCFPLMCNDKGTPHGWYLKPDTSIDIPGMDLAQALSLMLVEQSLPKMLPKNLYAGLAPRFNHARSKLQALADESPAARWTNKVASVNPQLDMQAPELNSEVLASVQEALLYDLQISAVYNAVTKDEPKQLTLSPLALVQRGLTLYLIATAENYTDPRQYALHRFTDVQILESEVKGAEDFDLKAYLASGALQFNPKEIIELCAWVDETAAKLLKETPISADMQLTPMAGGYELRASVRDSWQLQWWILQQGPSICVQSPVELRESIVERMKRALGRYEKSQVTETTTA